MQTQTASKRNGKSEKPPVSIRKGEGGKTITLDPLKDRINELERLSVVASAAAEDFSSAVKKAAEVCGLNAAAIRKFVSARVGDNFSKKQAECEQLALLFEEVGE